MIPYFAAVQYELLVVGAIMREFMDKGVLNLTFVYHKDTRHLETVSHLLISHTIAVNYGSLETPNPGLQTKELSEVTLHQSKLGVELTLGVTNVRGTRQIITLEEALGHLINRHVDKDDLSPDLFNPIFDFGNIRKGLPAEGTAKVA